MSDAPDPNSTAAQQTQEKLEFYVLALTFTVLGLSVQTAAFGKSAVADALEIVGWFSLLGSGLIGLRRLEDKPFFYHLHALKERFDARAKGIRKVQAQGQRVVTSLEDGLQHPVETVLGNATESVAKIEDEIRPLQTTLRRRYFWQRSLFAFGFIVLATGRAFVPVRGMVASQIYTFTDDIAHTVYRMRIAVDRDQARVRMVVRAPVPEIAVWGTGGTFRDPIVSKCTVFDERDWECSNVNTALPNKIGTPTEVGRLEMHEGVLSETPLSGEARRYAVRWAMFGKW